MRRFREMFKTIPKNVTKDSGECCWKLQRMFKRIPENVRKDSGEWLFSEAWHPVIHVGKNDLTNAINLLNNATKIFKKINKKLPETWMAFSSIINKKTGKALTKNLQRPIKDWKTNVSINEASINASINEDCLGVKKFHLNRKSNSCFAKNLLKYLNNIWLDSDTVRQESVQKINC